MAIRGGFRCDCGRYISIGARTLVNFDCVMLDVASISIGSACQLATCIQLLTATHPIDPEPRRLGWEYGQPITIGATSPRRPPGSGFRYSSVGFGLLGDALAARAGVPYARLLEERICAPVRPHGTAISLSPQQRPRLLQGSSRRVVRSPATRYRTISSRCSRRSVSTAGAS